MIHRYRWYEKAALYLAVTLFLLILLFPFFEAVKAAFSPLSSLFRAPWHLLPEHFTLEPWRDMWRRVPYLPRYIYNSLLIAGVSTLLTLLLAVPAAYALTRLPLPGVRYLWAMFLGVNLFSGAVLLIPLYRMMKQWGLLNSYAGMIVPGTAFLIPTAIWLLRTYLTQIPRDLEEAARCDGASRLYILRRVVLPLIKPGLVAVAVITFINSYAHQFIFALTFNSRREFMPISVGIFDFFGRNTVQWNELMAACVVGILPALLIFIVLQRYLIDGLTRGAVKH
ncbi:carbohydrate ABC transporter permease [Citrobacter koseri]|uniref:carbohydrate ABC transporter permease n=1 Tax=Citrobacter koseri TaxID=545 RepID=UPI0038927E9C